MDIAVNLSLNLFVMFLQKLISFINSSITEENKFEERQNVRTATVILQLHHKFEGEMKK